jgi:hypothetical protein
MAAALGKRHDYITKDAIDALATIKKQLDLHIVLVARQAELVGESQIDRAIFGKRRKRSSKRKKIRHSTSSRAKVRAGIEEGRGVANASSTALRRPILLPAMGAQTGSRRSGCTAAGSVQMIVCILIVTGANGGKSSPQLRWLRGDRNYLHRGKTRRKKY